MTYHDGEIEVQTRAGVREEAQRLCTLVQHELPPPAIEFLQKQPFAIASSMASDGSLWASLLPGAMQVLDPHTIELPATSIRKDDPIAQNLAVHPQIGLLVIDLANRKRLRVNGCAALSAQGWRVQIQQTFFNCPKYIQTRHLESISAPNCDSRAQRRTALSEHDCHWISTADTFFIATSHAAQGCDASHRGGNPGFVQVMNDHQLVFPDYAGNNMFQTLGNLTHHPKAGLLLIDFEQGHTLQLSGQAVIIWEQDRCQSFPGAQRLVEFTIEQILATQNVTPLRWQFGTFSPANP
jgi:uncharacterized protein